MKKAVSCDTAFFLRHRRNELLSGGKSSFLFCLNEPATVRNHMFRFGKIVSDLKRFFYGEPQTVKRDKSRDPVYPRRSPEPHKSGRTLQEWRQQCFGISYFAQEIILSNAFFLFAERSAPFIKPV